MGIEIRPTLAPDTNRPAEWDALNAQYDAATALMDRELVASPAYAAKEPARCNLVERMIAGDAVLCGFARTCGECPANLANTVAAPSAGHAVRHTHCAGGHVRNRKGLGE